MSGEMNLTSLKKLLFASILVLFASNAMAWGRAGHETVAEIASQLLMGTHAEQKLKYLLVGEETLVSVSIWADCVKGFQYCHAPLTPEMQAFVHHNPKHHHYHYADLPFQAQHYTEQGIGAHSDDVVHVLSEAIVTLRQGYPPPGRSWSQREALFLVVHLMGDLHQPLHVGAAYLDDHLQFTVPTNTRQADQMNNQGGNLLCNRSRPLHAAWDDDYVARVMRMHHAKTPAELSQDLVRTAGAIPIPSGQPEEWVKQWADESLKVSFQALNRISVVDVRGAGKGRAACSQSHEPDLLSDQTDSQAKKVWNIVLPEGYAEQASTTVADRMTLAGGRLALVLKTVWP